MGFGRVKKLRRFCCERTIRSHLLSQQTLWRWTSGEASWDTWGTCFCSDPSFKSFFFLFAGENESLYPYFLEDLMLIWALLESWLVMQTLRMCPMHITVIAQEHCSAGSRLICCRNTAWVLVGWTGVKLSQKLLDSDELDLSSDIYWSHTLWRRLDEDKVSHWGWCT